MTFDLNIQVKVIRHSIRLQGKCSFFRYGCRLQGKKSRRWL